MSEKHFFDNFMDDPGNVDSDMIKQHEEMTIEGTCPRCGCTEVYREEVDVGVGIIWAVWLP